MRNTPEQLQAELEKFCKKTFDQYNTEGWGNLGYSICINDNSGDDCMDFSVSLKMRDYKRGTEVVFRVNDDEELCRESIELLIGEEFEPFAVSQMWAYLFLNQLSYKS